MHHFIKREKQWQGISIIEIVLFTGVSNHSYILSSSNKNFILFVSNHISIHLLLLTFWGAIFTQYTFAEDLDKHWNYVRNLRKLNVCLEHFSCPLPPRLVSSLYLCFLYLLAGEILWPELRKWMCPELEFNMSTQEGTGYSPTPLLYPLSSICSQVTTVVSFISLSLWQLVYS